MKFCETFATFGALIPHNLKQPNFPYGVLFTILKFIEKTEPCVCCASTFRINAENENGARRKIPLNCDTFLARQKRFRASRHLVDARKCAVFGSNAQEMAKLSANAEAFKNTFE